MSEEAADQIGTEGTAEAKGPTIEETATAQGWNPDYDGDDKIDAAEFVRRKPLFDKIKGQGKELKEVKKLMEGMATTFKSMTEAQYKKGIADAEARMKTAEAAFDISEFKAASAEKQQLETAQAAHVAPASEPVEVTEFCERNPWFEKDPAMRTDALDYRENYLRRNPGAPVKDVLAYIEKKIARDYPDAFTEKPAAGKQTPAAAAVEGAGSTSKVDPIAKLKASMTGEERRIMKMFVKPGGLTEAEYLKDYAAVRGDK